MTRGRWVLVGLIAVAPLAAVLLLLAGVAFGFTRVAAFIVAFLMLLALLGALLAGLWLRRRVRRVRAAAEGEAVDLSRPAGAAVLRRVGTPAAEAIGLAARARDVPLHLLAAFGMATRSPHARDQLAGAATAWRFDHSSLASCLRNGVPHADVLRALGDSDPLALLMLARVISSQRLTDHDEEDARALVSLVARHPRVGELSRSARQLLLERLVIAGDEGAAHDLLGRDGGASLVERLFALDLMNPFAQDSSRDPSLWLATVNSIFRRVGLDPVRLEDGRGAALDRLRSAGSASVVEGPLVSVVMTCYRPDAEALRAAVESIIDQSWSNWELILLDDASPAEFLPMIDDLVRLDPRIELVTTETNGGTYLRRNDGLARARGEFVTFHDADDWAHPRRLEIQVRHLQAHPHLLANVSRSARVTSEVRFAQPRGTILRLTESSLLFRREEVLTRVGYFDSVRKAADSGYRRRIEAATGRPVRVVDVDAPLLLARYEATSLSADELRDGWTHPARVAYSNALGHWMASGARRLDHPLGERPFPAPAHLLGLPTTTHVLDVLYVLDVREDGRRRRETRGYDEEVRLAVASGLRVGVRRSEVLAERWAPMTTRAALQELINRGTLAEVLPEEGATARVVVILDEASLLGVAGDAEPVEADRVLEVPRERADGVDGVRWNRQATRAGATRLLGDRRPESIRLDELPELRAALTRG